MTERPHVPEEPEDLESTAVLLKRAQDGDRNAVNRLFDRYYPRLKAIAHGRLPSHSRDLRDTDDLVQETLIRAFKSLGRFEYRGEGKFLAYLRQILVNEIRQEFRRKSRKPGEEPLHDRHRDAGRTPGQIVSGWETIDRYEQALAKLGDEQHLAIVLRVEFNFSYAEIAAELGRPSANAARMVVARALARVAKLMGTASDGSDARDERSPA